MEVVSTHRLDAADVNVYKGAMKRVLITGGSGSYGQALIRRLLLISDAELCVYSRDEAKHSAMAAWTDSERVRFFIGDVRDQGRLRIALRGVDTVIHAAALKQVPAGEYNPTEFIATNIGGTENVLVEALEAGVDKVLVLSSDKASAPLTLYGASKAAAEALVRAFSSYSAGRTKFSCMRYGNVAGSRGSVIPVWRELIAKGERRMPVTDSAMTRFWFTLEEAVDFSLWCLDHMQGGETFVPELDAFRVIDLAAAMGCDWKLSGIRASEKLAELLVSADEAPHFRRWAEKALLVRFAEGFELGDALPVGFEYRSDRVGLLNVAQLRDRLEHV